jgi:HTH-type transcriptional regulator / antitoxin HipB
MNQIARTPKQLGEIFRRRRKEMGLTQEGLSQRIGMRQSTVSTLENSASDTRIGTLYTFMAALDMELVIRPRTKSSTQEIEDLF